jgi:hypothetical protein
MHSFRTKTDTLVNICQNTFSSIQAFIEKYSVAFRLEKLDHLVADFFDPRIRNSQWIRYI